MLSSSSQSVRCVSVTLPESVLHTLMESFAAIISPAFEPYMILWLVHRSNKWSPVDLLTAIQFLLGREQPFENATFFMCFSLTELSRITFSSSTASLFIEFMDGCRPFRLLTTLTLTESEMLALEYALSDRIKPLQEINESLDRLN